MRPTRCWPAAASSASSTRSTWPSSRSAGTASPTAWPSRSTSAGTPIPRPSRRTPAAPPPATGIDYLGIIAAEHEQAARRHRIRYDALAERGPGPSRASGGQEEGQ